MRIRTKRAYDGSDVADGRRVLVDRIWPRGLSKENVNCDEWIRDAAPSTELRRWFGHDPGRWDRFRERYHRELDANPAPVERLLAAAREGVLTLVYSARDTEHNQAVALAEYLERRLDR